LFTLAILITYMGSAYEGEDGWSYFTFSLKMPYAEVGCVISPGGAFHACLIRMTF